MTPSNSYTIEICRYGHNLATVDEARNIPPEQWQAIRRAIGRRLLQYESRLFSTGLPLGADVATLDNATPIPEPRGLEVADLANIRAELLREPRLMAIWFVDRLDTFLELREMWPDYHRDLMFYPSLVFFDRQSATLDDWLRAPWFAVVPGVWAEMSDGNHHYLLHYNSALEAQRAGERIEIEWIAPQLEEADAKAE